MRHIALAFFLAGLAICAQPDLLSQAPAVIVKCAPQYTPEARRAGIEGTVALNAHVHPDGRAHDPKVQRRLDPGLDAKAIEAVKQWRFSPGMKAGKPAVFPVTIEVKFRLNDMSEPCPKADR